VQVMGSSKSVSLFFLLWDLNLRQTDISLTLELAGCAHNLERQYASQFRSPTHATAVTQDAGDEATVLLHLHECEKDRVSREEGGCFENLAAVLLLGTDLRVLQFGIDISR